MIYINQSIPSYGASLNSIAKTVSNYPFKNMEQTKITLDCSSSVFVASDRLIVSLKGGEIYIITLLTDSESLRSIRSFNIEKGPSSVIPTCLTKCCDNYLFISSRLGNSVLLKYNQKTKNEPESSLKNDLVNSKDDEAEEKDDHENLEELDYEAIDENKKVTKIDLTN